MEVWLFLPQMRMDMAGILERARVAEAAGFEGIAFMDHLAPPMAEDQPMLDAMMTAAWVAAGTERLKVGHLVLCDAFHQPVVLAKQAVTIDAASGGRFELGIGWGSVPTEFPTFGVVPMEPRARVDRLGETLDVLRLLWSGEPVSLYGSHHTLVDAQTLPVPIDRIPIVIGGVGPRTLALVREHADWWNVPVHQLGEIEAKRETAGDARVSVQHMVAFVPPGGDRAEVEATAKRRFPGQLALGGMAVGGADEVVERFGALADQGVERVYAWFSDFAPPATLEAFAEVVAAVAVQ